MKRLLSQQMSHSIIFYKMMTYVAAKRIRKFLNSEELDENTVTHFKNELHPLMIESGQFTWDTSVDEIATLKNVNVSIRKGNLVAVVGPVGSGKSSLLSAFLGEMNKIDGLVNTYGSIAYVPQQAWLRNTSLRENILFMKPFVRRNYNRVVDSCALLPDFDVLSGGDMTEIGEKGVNLSGGQKQRISLARSVYNDADIYLLDDPLSAVDAHVGKHIFDKVIGPTGMLHKKTRLFVTNAITYLPEVDYIVMMKNGCIVESGVYTELLNKKGDFAEYISNYSVGESNESEIKEESVKKAHLKRERTFSEDAALSAPDTADIINAVEICSSSNDLVARDKLIEEEHIAEGQIKPAVYLYYIKSGGCYLWIVALSLNLLYQGLSIGANLWLTAWSTDTTIETEKSKKYFYLNMYTFFGVLQIISIVLGSLAMYLATTSASKRLHVQLLNKVMKWPTYMFDITPLGRIINRFSYDIDAIDNALPFSIRQIFMLGGTMLSTICVICISTPLMILFIIPIMALYGLLEQVYVAVVRQLKRLESVSRGPVYSHFSETITGATSIRAYGMEKQFIEESERRIRENQICSYPALIAQNWVGIRLDSIGNFIILMATLFAVLEKGTADAGIISLSITYALQISGSLNWVIRTASEIETNIISAERIKDYDKTPEEKLESSNYKSVPRNWPEKGIIEFDNYKTRYREGLDYVLHGLNLKIESGEKVGIVGRTGAGKSSLTLSLFRIIEAAEGRILIDDVDIADITLKSLRSRITIIPQDPVLFSGSVRLNLDPFFEYTDHELWNALEHAHLSDFIRSLNRGLDYVIAENGGNLSIGQRQLICLARALLRKTKILVLDEATAAIDLETDELIQKTIRREFQECTIMTIAHKLNTIMDSDKIVVLDQGVVKEYDTPNNLLQLKSSIFFGMAKEAGLVTV